MSIQINKLKCVGCGKCVEACPGNLIKKDTDGKAFIKHVKDCWGCTSCLKECRFEAINFFLGVYASLRDLKKNQFNVNCHKIVYFHL